MSKNGVFRLSSIETVDDHNILKRAALLFDKIYLRREQPPWLLLLRPYYSSGQRVLKDEQESLIGYLIDNGIIESFDNGDLVSSPDIELFFEEQLDMAEQYFSIEAEPSHFFKRFSSGKFEPNRYTQALYDIGTRIETIMLSQNKEQEFYPILLSDISFQHPKNKKDTIVQFLLEKIPQPDVSVSWEQIIEFRLDDEVRLKYLALINWINEIGHSSFTINEIKEKYEYLYRQYIDAYQRHKMKSSFSTLEILSSTAVALLIANVPLALTMASNFFKIGTTTVNLLQEEKNLPSKEIAYIYHAGEL